MSVVHVGHPPNEWFGWESHLVHFYNFASLPSGKNELVRSPEFISFGHVWRVKIYPGGYTKAKEGNISLFLEYCSEGDFSALFNVSIKKKVVEQSLSAAYLLASSTTKIHGVGMILLIVT